MSDQPIEVSLKQARAFLIANQGLDEPFASPEEAVKTLFAVQTQYAASLGVAVAARVKKLEPSWPDDAINRDPTLIKTWSLRSTLHVHHVSDRGLLKSFNTFQYGMYEAWTKKLQLQGVLPKDIDRQILNVLKSGPKTRVQIHDAVPHLKNLEHTGWGRDVKKLAYEGLVIFAPSEEGPSKFALANDWLGPIKDDKRTFREAMAEIFRRYLRSHAPASLNDFRLWCGVYSGPAKQALAANEKEVLPVRVQGMKDVRYILRDQEDSLRNAKRASGVRLLAKFDPLMMAHWDKQLYLDPKNRKTVFQMAGQVEASVLIDGLVAGIWRITTKGRAATIAIQPFRDFTDREIGRIEKEADRLRRALGLKEIALDHSAVHVTRA